MSVTPRPGAQTLGGARLIVGALMMGVVTLTIVAVAMHGKLGDEDGGAEATRILLFLLPAMPVAMVPGYVLMRSRFRTALSERHAEAKAEAAEGRVPREILSTAIIGAALAESVGLLGAIIYLLGGPWPALLAPGLALLLMAVQIPTRESVDQAVRSARRGRGRNHDA